MLHKFKNCIEKAGNSRFFNLLLKCCQIGIIDIERCRSLFNKKQKYALVSECLLAGNGFDHIYFKYRTGAFGFLF